MPSLSLLYLELKYCERCGGLWLRPAGEAGAYCASCARLMAELPPPELEIDPPRRRPTARHRRADVGRCA